MDKAIKLARKLKALAICGEGGEAENASRFLKDLCDKHGIGLEQLDDDAVLIHIVEQFETKEEAKFFCQVVAQVTGACEVYEVRVGGKAVRNELHCTQAQFVEVMAKHAHYWADYQTQKRAFYLAYIHKHELYPSSTDDADAPEEITEEDRLASRMMGGIRRSEYNAMIDKQ